jgi:hypothetical protein
MFDNGNKDPGKGIDKRNPFSLPESYFEQFPGRLQERLQTGKSSVIYPRESFRLSLRSQLAMAAAIAGLVISVYFGYTVYQQDDIPYDEIAGYIDHYQYEFSDYFFLGMLDDDLYPDDIILDESLMPDDHDIYIDYLYQDDISIELILSEI